VDNVFFKCEIPMNSPLRILYICKLFLKKHKIIFVKCMILQIQVTIM